jgi:hypothetical protein
VRSAYFIGPLQDGAAELGGEGWVRRCPAPEPDFDIQGPKGTVVPAKIFIVEAKEGAADSYCKLPSEGGPGVCDGTLYGGQPGASDCYAQVATNYLIGEDGALEITGENASVTFSGFVGSEVPRGHLLRVQPWVHWSL